MSARFEIGDYVMLAKEKEGIVKYCGKVKFASGIWVGIELGGGSIGKHDGMVKDHRYFSVRVIFYCV